MIGPDVSSILIQEDRHDCRDSRDFRRWITSPGKLDYRRLSPDGFWRGGEVDIRVEGSSLCEALASESVGDLIASLGMAEIGGVDCEEIYNRDQVQIFMIRNIRADLDGYIHLVRGFRDGDVLTIDGNWRMAVI